MLLIDNYDSFTYNLVDLVFQATGQKIQVIRNDEIPNSEGDFTNNCHSINSCHSRESGKDSVVAQYLTQLKPKAIIISPGPKDPDHAGITLAAIDYAAKTGTKLFGICLGHQAIGQYFGGKIIRAPKPEHGKVHEIYNNKTGILADVPAIFKATRYHSLVINPSSFPDCLNIDATSADGQIMAISHKTLPIYGLQFHPESILSEFGKEIMQNFCMM